MGLSDGSPSSQPEAPTAISAKLWRRTGPAVGRKPGQTMWCALSKITRPGATTGANGSFLHYHFLLVVLYDTMFYLVFLH